MSSPQQRNESAWVKAGRSKGATHVLDVCDQFDYSHYPVYVMPGEDPEEKRDEYNKKSMQSVYSLVEIKEGEEAEGENNA